MITSIILTPDEFKAIQNALCELDQLRDDRVSKIVERVRKEALANAYTQENEVLQTRMIYYNNVRDDMGFKTFWSIYTVEDLSCEHPFKGATKLIYREHDGNSTIEVPIRGNSWTALYEAADAAIRKSGDDRYAFIKSFDPVPDRLGVLALTTSKLRATEILC